MNLSRSTIKALGCDAFWTLDLETTGLDAHTDEILEIGLILWDGNRVCRRISHLVCPIRPIPRFVTRLTGIRMEDCEGKPAVEEILPEIWQVLEEGNWIIAHNASFDLGFLESARQQFLPEKNPIPAGRAIDTVELARLLLPWNPNHRLETLADHFSIAMPKAHRAPDDAETAGSVFLECARLALGLHPRTVQSVLSLLNGAADGLRFFFERIESMQARPQASGAPRRKGPVNRLGRPGEEPQKGPLPRMEKVLGKEGSLSRILPEFEFRKPQVEMANQVSRAFKQSEFLLAEAGTGVGKSMAYLIPAVLWASRNSSRVIISTHTKTLQDQLFQKDLPLLIRAIEDPFSAVLLKGRANYLCRRRWEEALMGGAASQWIRRKLLPLTVWADDTRTGDVEECSGFSRERDWDAWREVNSDFGACQGQHCTHESDCFYGAIRQAVRQAQIVIVNHALLFSDVAAGSQVIGDYDCLIVDEAHQMERAASQVLGRTLQIKMFKDFIARMYRHGNPPSGWVADLERLCGDGQDENSELDNKIEELKTALFSLDENAQKFFNELTRCESAETSGRVKRRIRGSKNLIDPLETAPDLEHSIQEMLQIMKSFAEHLKKGDLGNTGDLLYERFEWLCLTTVWFHENWMFFRQDTYEEDVVWTERARADQPVSLFSVPLQVGEILVDRLYPNLKCCVMTSATLSIADEFEYIKSRLGLDRIEPERLAARIFGSPFDFQEQTRFIVPTFMSNPKEASFSREVAELLEHVLEKHGRGTMVLFTSHQMLREVYDRIYPSLENRGIHLLGQGIDGPRHVILKRFQEDVGSVLFGTSSFWEGVDVPGAALEMLVIPKIPFEVPTEPVVEARMELAARSTGNGFMNYSVPEAVVRFRQGFGRLIRTAADRGVVLLLDHRVVTAQYGSVFLESLPVSPVLCGTEEEMLSELESWFEPVL